MALACVALLCAVAFNLMPGEALAATAASITDSHGWNLSREALGSLLLGGFTVAELKKRKGEILAGIEAIGKLATDALTDEKRSEFDKLEKELETVEADIKRAEKTEDLRRRAAADAAAGADDADQPQNQMEQRAQQYPVPAQPAAQRDPGHDFGCFVRSYATHAYSMRDGSGKIVTPAQAAVSLYGERHHVTEMVIRAQTLSENAGGGFAVPPTLATEIIRLFGPRTIVRRRAQVVPGNADYLKGKTGAAVSYVGENEQGILTGVTFGMLSMREKDISAILPISKKLLRNTAFGVEGYCRDELVRAAAEFEDRMFLYAPGTGKQVKGYAYAIPAGQKFVATNSTTPTNANVRSDCRKLLKAMADANVELSGNEPAWFMNPGHLLYLRDLYQGDLLAFPTLQGDNPTLYGYPVDTSTQVTGPSGSGGDIFFGAHRYAMIGDSVAMSLSVSDQASFKDAGGQQINMWAQGLMAIKLDMSHDFALRYEQAFAQLTEVKWGG
ncbi:capsid protein [alpha proteobacterium AAP38]|nr:capsid protein [alpha proteobacterium AAP38]